MSRRVSRPLRPSTGRAKSAKPPAKSASARARGASKTKKSGRKAPSRRPKAARAAAGRSTAPKAAKKDSKTRKPRGRQRPPAVLRRVPSLVPAGQPILTSEGNGPYRPSEREPFMNERMREYFRYKLQSWMDDILREFRETDRSLQLDQDDQADDVDRANAIEARNLKLRAQERQANLIRKIEAALARIDEGTYGYCEVTGDPIGIRRLEARPIATRSIEAQESWEKREGLYAES